MASHEKRNIWELFDLILAPYGKCWVLSDKDIDTLFWSEAERVLCESQYEALYCVYSGEYTWSEAQSQSGMTSDSLSSCISRAVMKLRNDRTVFILCNGCTPESKGISSETPLSLMPLSTIALVKLGKRNIKQVGDLSKHTVASLGRMYGMYGDYVNSIDTFLMSKEFIKYRRNTK